MRFLTKMGMGLRSLFRRNVADTELDAELRFHVERQIAANIAAGMSAADARRAALREFGGVEQLKEECRDMRKVNWLQDLAQDLRYGLRMLRKSPGFSTVAVLTLALGIGANTAIFSIVDAVLLRSFPYPHPNQLVLMFNTPLKQPEALSALSYRDFTACRGQNRVFSGMAGNAFHDLTLTGGGEPSIVNTADVTPEIFSVLGAKPVAGRTLLPEDGKRGAAPVAVVSESLWPAALAQIRISLANPLPWTCVRSPSSEFCRLVFVIPTAHLVKTCGFRSRKTLSSDLCCRGPAFL